MKIRMIALAGVAALALSTPAMAAEGWYLGLGAGWDQQNGVKLSSVPVPSAVVTSKASSGALVAGSAGYAWDNGFRLEDEIGWSGHNVKVPAGSAGGGYTSVETDMANLVYDIPLDEGWKLSIGAGIGAGKSRVHAYGPVGLGGVNFDIVNGSRIGLAYQGIAGVAYSVSDDVDLFLDYRYRNIAVGNIASGLTGVSPFKVGNITENAVMVGLRWFMTPPPPPPPPPPRPRPRRRLPRRRPRRRLPRRLRRRRTLCSSTLISRTSQRKRSRP